MNLIYDFRFNNSNIILCCITASSVCFLGLSFIGSYFKPNKIDIGIQTDAWEDYSERASQVTITPRISPMEYIDTGAQTIAESSSNISNVTTILPIPPFNIPYIPNPDIFNKSVNTSIVDLLDGNRVQQISDILTVFGS